MRQDKRYGSAPIQTIEMMSEEAQREWDALDPKVKRLVTHHLNESVKMMSNTVAIQTMAFYIQELAERIEKLEKGLNDHN